MKNLWLKAGVLILSALLVSGTFRLSELLDVASIGWDGRTFAICTWANVTEIRY